MNGERLLRYDALTPGTLATGSAGVIFDGEYDGENDVEVPVEVTVELTGEQQKLTAN